MATLTDLVPRDPWWTSPLIWSGNCSTSQQWQFVIAKPNSMNHDPSSLPSFSTSLSASGSTHYYLTMSNPIEHEKPLEARTYEQTSMLDAYLYFHFGDSSPVSYIETGVESDNTFPAKYTLQCPTASNNLNSNFGDFGFLNQSSGQIGKPYGADFLSQLPNFPEQVAKMAIHWYQQINPGHSRDDLKAIDLGCSVGRTSFDLSTYFPTVTGLDFSRLFVQTATALASGRQYEYRIPIEGELSYKVQYQYSPIPNTTLNFVEGDACNLPTDKKYHCVTGANLIDRLPVPLQFFKTLPSIVEKNGLVVLTSPYTWLEQYTPRANWLPNLALDKDTGDLLPEGSEPTQATTFEALFTIMNPHFELVHHSHLPFFIHETARKAQYSLAHCTVWRRRD